MTRHIKKALLFVLFAAGFLWVRGVAFADDVRDPVECHNLLVRDENRQILRKTFNDQYADRIYSSPTQNEVYIGEVMYPQRNSPTRLYVVVENAWMKKLNDQVLKDKDLVTALTNYHKELFLKNFKEFAPMSASKIMTMYSDFKSLRLIISGDTNEYLEEIKYVF